MNGSQRPGNAQSIKLFHCGWSIIQRLLNDLFFSPDLVMKYLHGESLDFKSWRPGLTLSHCPN